MAVVLMVFYHFMWDLAFFALYGADVTQCAWRLFARTIATTFLLLVGVSLAVAPLLWRLRRFALAAGAGLVVAGQVLARWSVASLWGVPLGLAPAAYPAVDYFPLVPWLGLILIGLGLAERLG